MSTPSFLAKNTVLVAGIAVAAVVYFMAKPVHQAAEHEAQTPAAEHTSAPVEPAKPAVVAAPVIQAEAKILFAIGKASLPADAAKTLEPVIAKLKANPTAKAVISGFNDATGDKAKNELLAKERAKSVREALRKAGVAGDNDARIEMKKPEETTGGVDAEQARRVDVTVI